MSVCAVIGADGQILQSEELAPECSQLVMLTAADYDDFRNPFAQDPDFGVVYWACGAMLVLWAVSFGAGVVIAMIRRAR